MVCKRIYQAMLNYFQKQLAFVFFCYNLTIASEKNLLFLSSIKNIF